MSITFIYNEPCVTCGKLIVKSKSGKCGSCARKGIIFTKQHCLNISKSHKGLRLAEHFKPKLRARMAGSSNPHWKGGELFTKQGYKTIYSPEHPYRDVRGYVLKHRLIMEKHLGRYLKPEEVVHHKNENKTDNRYRNLKLFKNQSEHLRYHRTHY